MSRPDATCSGTEGAGRNRLLDATSWATL